MEQLSTRASLFADNASDMRHAFVWHDALTKRLAALLYALADKPIDEDAIRSCHERIKRRTGGFSMFRGNMAIALAALLSLARDPDAVLDGALDAYDRMKAARFRASDYLVIAAYQIAANVPRDRYDAVIARARAFYDGMKAEHWMLTGEDDYIYCAMLGLSDIDVATGLGDLEALYQGGKATFSSGNAVQGLAQVLVLGGATPDALDRLHALRAALHDDGNRMDRSYTLSALGVLALLPMDVGVVVREIDEVSTALRQRKGFGALTVSKQELLLYAASLVASVGMDDARNGILPAISTNLANILIAQQAAMTAAIVGASVAANASHNG